MKSEYIDKIINNIDLILDKDKEEENDKFSDDKSI